jgi:hypothetical protein
MNIFGKHLQLLFGSLDVYGVLGLHIEIKSKPCLFFQLTNDNYYRSEAICILKQLV